MQHTCRTCGLTFSAAVEKCPLGCNEVKEPVVSSPESRCNNIAFEACRSLFGSMWAYWGEPEWNFYYTVYKSAYTYERNSINEKYREEAANGSI